MKIVKFQLTKQLLVSLTVFLSISTAYSAHDELLDLSVEDLLNVKVISVAKKAKSLNDSPAAIFVISQDDIKRIGVTSIPEALRLAPGIDVARIDANKWAVSARGFNGRFANKLLVLIDGRNAYTRTFAGVYWENQDVMLEDVERIEVIRGPGATLWGANAVNGVINIITKHSADTQGGLLVAGAGNQEQGFGAFRYGAELSDNTTARAYVKGFQRNENSLASGEGAGDGWGKVQSGFRMDSLATVSDAITFQGDMYYNNVSQHTTTPQTTAPYLSNFNEQIKSFGGNLLGRHQHTFSATSDYSLQVYYDFYQRDESALKETRHTLDIDFQHRFSLLDWNDIVWGLGYRYNHDNFPATSLVSLSPVSRNDQLFSAFIQDELTLIDNALWLTLGAKFEHNDYSGFEVQPTARLMWAPHYHHRLWAAVSRSVRTPSRAEQDITLLQTVVKPELAPAVEVIFEGNKDYTSEVVLSYEAGYRTTLIDNVSIDFTAFYNDYSNLRSIDRGSLSFNGSNLVQPLNIANNNQVQTYGFEIATVWQMLNWWRWDANYSLLKVNFIGKSVKQVGVSPQQQFSLRSAVSPLPNVDIDFFFRYIDSSSTIGRLDAVIDDYVSMDIRLAWRPVNDLELSLVGQNLLSAHHLEHQEETAYTTPTEINRGVYGKLAWHF